MPFLAELDSTIASIKALCEQLDELCGGIEWRIAQVDAFNAQCEASHN